MTKKQRRFIELKAMGVANKEAAIQAGYAPNSADVTAGKLMMRADVREAIGQGQASSSVDKSQGMPRAHYPDSLTFLMDAMNNAALPVPMRIDAAKSLLPYQHARLGEKGKKEKRKEEADRLTGGRGRFQTMPPPQPKLRAIEGGKPPN